MDLCTNNPTSASQNPKNENHSGSCESTRTAYSWPHSLADALLRLRKEVPAQQYMVDLTQELKRLGCGSLITRDSGCALGEAMEILSQIRSAIS